MRRSYLNGRQVVSIRPASGAKNRIREAKQMAFWVLGGAEIACKSAGAPSTKSRKARASRRWAAAPDPWGRIEKLFHTTTAKSYSVPIVGS
jgi:hypothetical protein